MKSVKFGQIIILLSTLSASSLAVFRPPEDPSKDSDQSGAPWHPDWEKVVGCEKGETQSRFPACWCGQYAKIVKEVQSIPLEELENEGYHYKWRKGRKIYYVCLPCSSCPDGIRMTRKCRQERDTTCDLDQCINPNRVFDQGKKACVPTSQELPELEEQTEDPAIALDEPTVGPVKNKFSPLLAHADEQEFEDPSQLKVWHQHAVIITIAVFLVAVVIVNIILIVTVIHRKRMRYRTLTRVASNLSQATTQTGCTCMHETPV